MSATTQAAPARTAFARRDAATLRAVHTSAARVARARTLVTRAADPDAARVFHIAAERDLRRTARRARQEGIAPRLVRVAIVAGLADHDAADGDE